MLLIAMSSLHACTWRRTKSRRSICGKYIVGEWVCYHARGVMHIGRVTISNKCAGAYTTCVVEDRVCRWLAQCQQHNSQPETRKRPDRLFHCATYMPPLQKPDVVVIIQNCRAPYSRKHSTNQYILSVSYCSTWRG